MHSIFEAIGVLSQAGITTSVSVIAGNCYLDHTRNLLVREFLRSDMTDLLFIDADIGFDPVAALRLAVLQRPLVGGVYPKKNDTTAWPVEFDRLYITTEPDGTLEAPWLPTGFLRVNRSVFQALDALKPPECYKEPDGSEVKGYFHCGIHDGLYWGEDFQFCADWRGIGGKAFMLPDITFSHIGPKAWKGNWAEWSKAHGKEAAKQRLVEDLTKRGLVDLIDKSLGELMAMDQTNA